METGDDGGYDAFAGSYLSYSLSRLGLRPFSAHLRETLPGLMPGGRGGFALSINRSSYPGGNTRTGFFNEPGRTDVGPGRVMPLREYDNPSILTIHYSDPWVDILQKTPGIEAGELREKASPRPWPTLSH